MTLGGMPHGFERCRWLPPSPRKAGIAAQRLSNGVFRVVSRDESGRKPHFCVCFGRFRPVKVCERGALQEGQSFTVGVDTDGRPLGLSFDFMDPQAGLKASGSALKTP